VSTWRPTVRQRLPFRATLLYSDDDPFGATSHTVQTAADWGASAFSVGAAGHVNGDSGLGDWPAGLAHLTRLAEPAGNAAEAGCAG
jgi:predicted alpha/beta hydrolase family esterase